MMMKEGAKQRRIGTKSSFAQAARFFTQLKRLLYSSLIETLNVPETSVGIAVVVLFATWLQVWSISFSQTIYPIWQSDKITYYISVFTRFSLLSPLVKLSTNATVLVVISMVAAGIVIFAFLFMILTANVRSFKSVNPVIIVSINQVLFRSLTTFLTIPIFDLLIATLYCTTNANGVQVLGLYNDMVCYTGIHLVATILSAIGLAVYAIYGISVALWYFEFSGTNRSAFARNPSLCNVVQFLHMAVFAILSNLFAEKTFGYFVVLTLLTFSLLLFYFNYIESPFHNRPISLISAIFSTAHLWTVFMLVFAQIFEGNILEGSFAIFALGLPFVVAIVFTRPDKNVELLLLSWNKVQNSDLITKQLRYLIDLWARKDFDRKSAIILEGYLEIHREICDQTDCPINNVTNGRTGGESPEEVSELILSFIEYSFQASISKFQNNIDLRLTYISFLEERVQKSHEALKELEILATLKCGIERDFIVFRKRQRIQEFNEGAREVPTAIDKTDASQHEVAFQSLLNRFIALMEEICMLYTEFWSHLLEEVPNLNKIREFGSEIAKSTSKIEGIWRKFYAVSSTQKAKYLIFYGRFQKSILNNHFKGDELIKKAREIIAILANKKNDIFATNGPPEISEFQLAGIVVSGYKKSVGEILQINEAACALFGYHHSEIIGKNIKVLIPNTFSLHHDTYLERAAASQSLGFFSKEKLIFGKSKAGYLIPLQIQIQIIQGRKLSFFGRVRPYKSLQVVGFILVDYKGRIESISAGIVYMFSFDMKSVAKENSLDYYFINLFALKEKYLDVGEELFETGHVNQQYFNNQLTNHRLMVELTRHKHPMMVKEYYIFKFTSLTEETNVSPPQKKCRLSDFQFRIDPQTQILIGQKVRAKRDINENIENSRGKAEGLTRRPSRTQRNSSVEVYSTNIKLYRLSAGKVIEIDYFTEEDGDKNELEMRKEDEINKLRDQKENEEENESLITSISNNTALKDHLDRKPMPAFMRMYIALIVVLSLGLCSAVFYEFLAKRSKIDSLGHYQNFFARFNLIIGEYQNLVDVNNRLMMLASGAPMNRGLSEMTSYLNYSINMIESTETELMDELHYLKDPVLSTLMLNTTFNLYFSNNASSQMNYAEIMKQIVTQNLILANTTLDQMTWADGSVTYLTVVNLLGGIWKQLSDSNNLIIKQMTSVATAAIPFIITQALCLVIVLSSVTLTYFFTLRFNKHVSGTFDLFLDISNSNVKKYMFRCETFAALIQSRETDEIGSDQEDNEIEEGDRSIIVSRKRRRNNAIKLSVPQSFYVKFAIAVIMVEAILAALFFFHSDQMTTFASIASELNITAVIGSNFHMIYNTQNLRLADLFTKVNPNLAATLEPATFEVQFNLDSAINVAQLSNTNFHSDSYLQTIYKIMNGNLCNSIDPSNQLYYQPFYPVNQTACKLLEANPNYNSFFSSGLSISLAKYQDEIRTIYSSLEKLNSSVADANAFANSTCQSASDYHTLCFFTAPIFESLYTFQHYYFNYFMQLLLNGLTRDTQNQVLNSTAMIEVYLFIGFLAVVFMLFLFLFLRNFLDVWSSLRIAEKMVLMIPLENIRKSNYIKGFFKSLVKEIINK